MTLTARGRILKGIACRPREVDCWEIAKVLDDGAVTGGALVRITNCLDSKMEARSDILADCPTCCVKRSYVAPRASPGDATVST